MSESRIALTHASSLLAEGIIESMVESGISPDSVILLDDPDLARSRQAYADGYLPVLDQYDYDYEGLDAVLLIQQDDELQGLLQHADCMVLSHIGNKDQALYFDASDDSSVLPDSPGYVQLAGAELSTMMLVLRPLSQLAAIRSVSAVNVQSAAVFGKSGVDELAAQTIALLNSRDSDAQVFPLQLAFNMIPTRPVVGMDQQLSALLGGSAVFCSMQNIVVAAFHGLAIAVSLEFEQEIDLDLVRQRLQSGSGIVLTEQIVSPYSHCREGFEVQLFGLAQGQNATNRLQFWLIADGIRNGLVKNYQNAIQVLPNLVL